MRNKQSFPLRSTEPPYILLSLPIKAASSQCHTAALPHTQLHSCHHLCHPDARSTFTAALPLTRAPCCRLPTSTVHRIVAEAVELEREFCCEALSVALVGMNAELMAQYIEFVADRLLVALGYPKAYNTANPLDWMEMISLQ